MVIPELGKRLRGFRWKFFGMWGLIALLLGIMNYRFVDAQLANDDALRQDMRLVVDAVASETVDHVDGFLAPAHEASRVLRGVIERDELALHSQEVETILVELIRARGSFDGAFVGASDGSFVYARRDGDGLVLKRIHTEGRREVTLQEFDADLNLLSERVDPEDQYDPRQRPWYMASISGGSQWTSPYVFFSTKQPGITYSQPPTVGANGIQMVVGIDIRLAELSSFVGSRRPSDGAEVFIVDGSDAIVAHPELAGLPLEEIPQGSEFGDPAVALVSDLVMDRREGRILDLEVTEQVDDEPSLTVLRQLSLNEGWFVAVTAPEADFLATARAANRNALLSAFAGTAVVFAALLVLGWFIGRDYRRLLGQVDDTTKNLQRSNTELERYADAVTHELITPIRAIGGYVEEAQRRLDMSAEVGTVLDRAMQAQRNVSETVTHLLDRAMARPTRIESVPVSIDDVVASVASSHSAKLIDAKAVLEIPRPLGTVLLNEPTLRVAIQNLVDNSLRYRHPDRDLVVTLTTVVDGDQVILNVRDNGRGIPAEKRNKIFDAYERADTSTTGVGIGLATVSSMLGDHGATIAVTPDVANGAEFTIGMASAGDATIADKELDLRESGEQQATDENPVETENQAPGEPPGPEEKQSPKEKKVGAQNG